MLHVIVTDPKMLADNDGIQLLLETVCTQLCRTSRENNYINAGLKMLASLAPIYTAMAGVPQEAAGGKEG